MSILFLLDKYMVAGHSCINGTVWVRLLFRVSNVTFFFHNERSGRSSQLVLFANSLARCSRQLCGGFNCEKGLPADLLLPMLAAQPIGLKVPYIERIFLYCSPHTLFVVFGSTFTAP